jgi:hypothetical protein
MFIRLCKKLKITMVQNKFLNVHILYYIYKPKKKERKEKLKIIKLLNKII